VPSAALTRAEKSSRWERQLKLGDKRQRLRCRQGFILGLAKSLARELGSRNICVNAVAPGLIETDMTADFPEDIKTDLEKEIPLARLGTPEDVAGVVAFLASEEAAYITGQVIRVNGGLYM